MVELNEKEQLEELKEKIGEIKTDIANYIEDKFDDIFALINGRIEEICDEEHDDEFEDHDEEEQDEYEERDVRDELTSEQAEEASVLSQSIASQIQRAGQNQENSDEEAPVVVNSPAPSLAESIKKQIDEVKTVATETPVNLAEQIAKQVADKNNIAVVVPATSEGIVDIPQPVEAAPRPLGQIIEELRSSVKTGVDATSEEKTEQLVEQAATQTPSGLAQDIKVQALSDSIKKQL
ncbi:hypothetical protein OB985_04445 [Bacillus cereus]|nr:hypothetical protein [Bacillus cereus]